MLTPKTSLLETAKISLVLVSILFLSAAARADLPRVSTIRCGAVVGRPHFEIDKTSNVAGVPTRFMTGRPNDYVGSYIDVDWLNPHGKHAGLGWVAGGTYWQTGYWLNWDIPELGVSLDPLRSWWQVVHTYGGALGYVQAGPARLLASVKLVFGYSSFRLKSGNTSETGSDEYAGIQPGIEARLQLSRVVGLTAGYNTILLLDRYPDYEVEPGVRLHGEHTAWPTEIQAGLSFSKN